MDNPYFDTSNIPLSLYIHIPWCVKKCPYCDFNSHTLRSAQPPESEYISALTRQMQQYVSLVKDRPIQTIFFGGGTPSLFSPLAIQQILQNVRAYFTVAPGAEITLEANPGTVDQTRFSGFYQAGVNRISIGIQTFNPSHLHKIGRIHDDQEAKQAVKSAQKAGFKNINIDLMYGLSEQSLTECIHDLETALSLETSHLSWYQLTIEPNTLFHKWQPPIPQHDAIVEMEQAGTSLLHNQGFERYEISAWCHKDIGSPCLHNTHVWQYGDYLGLGAGACGKITTKQHIIRTMHSKSPRAYIDGKGTLNDRIVSTEDRAFEFILNHLRLYESLSFDLFEQRTKVTRTTLIQTLEQAPENTVSIHKDGITLLELGHRFYNDIVALFLPEHTGK